MKQWTKCKVCNSNIELINSSYELVECGNCGLVFCKKKFTQNEIESVYKNLYETSNSYQSHQKEFNQLKNGIKVPIGRNREYLVKKLLSYNPKSFCEIGAGVGLIGSYLKDYNNIDYHGIELDPSTAQKARSLGLNVATGDFELLADYPNSFDVIFASEVIEHLQDLGTFFKLANGALDASGILSFTVPNYSKVKNYSKAGKKIYQDPPPIHLNFFTTENISKIARIQGYDILFLKKKKLPYLNLKKLETYKFIFMSVFGKYEGPTIYCIAKKKKNESSDC